MRVISGMCDGAVLPVPAGTLLPPEWERTYPGRKDQAREVRAAVRGVLGGCPMADDVILLISELAGNAVCYSDSSLPGGTFTVRVADFPGDYVYAEVEDQGSDWHGDLARSAKHPHGLYLVRQLAATCGVDCCRRVRIVWFTIGYPAKAAAAELAR